MRRRWSPFPSPSFRSPSASTHSIASRRSTSSAWATPWSIWAKRSSCGASWDSRVILCDPARCIDASASGPELVGQALVLGERPELGHPAVPDVEDVHLHRLVGLALAAAPRSQQGHDVLVVA